MGGMDAFQSERGGRGDSVLGIVFNYPPASMQLQYWTIAFNSL